MSYNKKIGCFVQREFLNTYVQKKNVSNIQFNLICITLFSSYNTLLNNMLKCIHTNKLPAIHT